MAMLLAVLHRHGGLYMADQDVFVNVVGGVKVSETSADLALLLAIVSSFKDRPVDRQTVAFGEVGLAGEIRPVQGGQERLQEASSTASGALLSRRLMCPSPRLKVLR